MSRELTLSERFGRIEARKQQVYGQLFGYQQPRRIVTDGAPYRGRGRGQQQQYRNQNQQQRPNLNSSLQGVTKVTTQRRGYSNGGQYFQRGYRPVRESSTGARGNSFNSTRGSFRGRGNFSQRGGQQRGRGGFRGRGGRWQYSDEPAPTPEELDAELEEYMSQDKNWVQNSLDAELDAYMAENTSAPANA
eukprot:TRINITY_DN817_c0_g1_i1.p2 TRINITY_DN817_c0_g1~~TRINITY_DN817_c0_g1_i1.p2  ORF type:complete len:190 (-),score=66.36 TRINITY_DN817_c0_g1_i1:314-883(-)